MGCSSIKSFFITLLAFVAFQFLSAHSFYKVNYNSNNGLPSSEVYHVFQDSKGFIWFSTNQGISRYDGYQFTNFDITDNLPRNTVFEAYEDYKGRIWFTSLTDDLCYFFNNKFHRYAYNRLLNKFRLVKNRNVSKRTFFVDSLDNIYYTRYAEKTIKIDKNGHAQWINLSDEGHRIILKINNNGTVLYNFSRSDSIPYIENVNGRFIQINAPKSFFSSDYTHSVVTDRYVIISFRNEVYVVERRSGKTLKYTFENSIIWMSQDQDGIIWIGFYNTGIKGFVDAEDLNRPLFHLLKKHSVSSICKDSEGSYWATTLNDGAFYFPSLQVQALKKSNELKVKSINTICSNDDQIWFAGNSPYLYSFDGQIKEWPWVKDFSSDIRKLVWFNNKLIVSVSSPRSMGGLINPEKRETRKVDVYFLGAKQILDGGIILCAPNHDYFEYRNNKFMHHYFPDQIVFKYIFDVCQDSLGNMWYGTERGLILKKNDRFVNMRDSNALYGTRVMCIVKDGDLMWMGTKGGGLLCKMPGALINYTTEDGLPSNSISDIIVDNDTLWLASNKGVAKFAGKPSIGKVETWSTANGLTNNEVNDIDLLNGTVYVATQDGLCYFPKSMCGINKTPPPVYINNIRINNRDTTLLNEYHLDYKHNHIIFSFVGINYQKINDIEYKYRLIGADNAWNYSTQTEARYSALLPGEYTFQLVAINNSGIQSAVPVEVKIIISTPYWRTRWFLLLSLLILIALLAFIVMSIFSYRMRTFKKQNCLKQEMNKFRQKALSSQMNPHFLYNSINSAQYFILNNDPNTASDYLSGLGKLMRLVLNNSMYDRVSLKEELKALFLYVEMEQKRFDYTFEFCKSIDRNINLDRTLIPPLILQPYVENAIHHGLRTKKGKRLLKLIIRTKGNCIIVEIEDNGVGRKQTERSERNKNSSTHISFGTEITKHRLMILEEVYSKKMTVDIDDLYNNDDKPEGTKVTLTINQDAFL
jgi:streptogramin lyase